MDLLQLKAQTAALAAQAFRPSTMANHVHEADCFIKFSEIHQSFTLHPLRLHHTLVSYLLFFKKHQELCLQGPVCSQAAPRSGFFTSSMA